MSHENTTPERFSIFYTCLWLLVLTLGIQSIVGFLIGIGIGLTAADELENIEQLFLRPDILALTVVLSAIFALPLIKKASHQASLSSQLAFLTIKSINIKTLSKVLGAGIVFLLLQHAVIQIFEINTPQFLLDVKALTHSTFDLLLIVLSICVVAPIVEEIIFRGLGYSRLVKSAVGSIGAVLITSLVFTVIHIQYDLEVLMILFCFALLLAAVRYKTNNIVYCIALHALNNITATAQLYLYQ